MGANGGIARIRMSTTGQITVDYADNDRYVDFMSLVEAELEV